MLLLALFAGALLGSHKPGELVVVAWGWRWRGWLGWRCGRLVGWLGGSLKDWCGWLGRACLQLGHGPQVARALLGGAKPA